jgi:hypothetical protein
MGERSRGTPGEEDAMTTTTVRTNRYEGTCEACGGRVPADTGTIRRDPRGTWLVRHNGPCPQLTPDEAALRFMGGPPVATPTPPTVDYDVPQGHYAVPGAGHQALDFYKVDRPTTGKWAGYTFVKTIIGGHPENRVPRGEVDSVLERIDSYGVGLAATTYGIEIQRCCCCNTRLTDTLSRELGIGPDCRAGKTKSAPVLAALLQAGEEVE